MVTQIVLGRVWDFGYVIGRWGVSGEALYIPVNTCLGKDDIMYVLNRGYELVPNSPWNRTVGGTHITKIRAGTEPGDEELIAEFLKYGDSPGDLIWPSGMALDSQENIYVTDEWMNRVSVYDSNGAFIKLWGTAGSGDGELNRPSGIATDGNDQFFIVDSLNHRVQRFNMDGEFLGNWGSFGSGPGQFNTPWGIGFDQDGRVYVADYKNDRVQKFSPDGTYLAEFGSSGTGRGELRRPSDVSVDAEGDVYVCDWGNNRVQVYNEDGKFMTTFIGDARELSKWARQLVESNPDAMKRRREVKTLEPEWRFERPVGVTFDVTKRRLLVCDTNRHRIQIYNKVNNYLEPQRNL